ncbi:hypothetical protein KUCAC02_032040, partial [Chaenocephalus aceratus]
RAPAFGAAARDGEGSVNVKGVNNGAGGVERENQRPSLRERRLERSRRAHTLRALPSPLCTVFDRLGDDNEGEGDGDGNKERRILSLESSVCSKLNLKLSDTGSNGLQDVEHVGISSSMA